MKLLMIIAAWDILQDTDWLSGPERQTLRWVCGSYLRHNWNVVMASSLQKVENNSRWFSCVTQRERRFAELDVSVAEHKVNVWIPIELDASSWDIDKDDVLASSK